MIRKLTQTDHAKLMTYLSREAAINLFLIGDVEQFGYDADFQTLYGEFEQQDIVSVLLQYRNSLIYYSHEKRSLACYQPLLESLDYLMVAGKLELIEPFKEMVPYEHEKPMYFSELTQLNIASNRQIDVKKASSEDDLRLIHNMLLTIQEFRKIPWDEYLASSMFKLGESADGIYMIREGEKLIATAATAATNSLSTMIVGVATNPEYRKRGLATDLVIQIVTEYLQKGKTLCLFYDNPEAGKIYERIGFNPIGRWQLLTLKEHSM